MWRIFLSPILAFFFWSFPAFAALKPITVFFDALKHEVLTTSPELQSLGALARQRNSARSTSITRWLPRIDLSLRQSRSKDYSLLTSGQLGSVVNLFPGGFTPAETNLASWYLNLNVPLFRRTVQLDVQRASAEREISERQLELALSRLAWQLRELLGNYIFQLYRITTLNTSTELARTNLRDVKLRFNLGQKTKVDLLRARANLLSLESKTFGVEEDRAKALSALLNYSGLSRERLQELLSGQSLDSEDVLRETIDDFTVTEETYPKVRNFLPSQDSQTYLGKLAARNPSFNFSYQTIMAEQRAAEATAQLLLAPEYPELLIQGFLSKQGPEWSGLATPAELSRSIALVLNIPIFSSGSLFSSSSEKRNAERAAEIKREREILKLKQEVEDQAFQLDRMQSQLSSQLLNVEQNRELVKLSRRSYQIGKSSLLELLTAENGWTEAKLTLAQSKLAYDVLIRKFAWNIGVILE